MKNLFYTLAFAIFALPMFANAATFSFAPSTATLVPGQTVNVTVYANPGAGEKVFTTKLVADFDANIASVTNFTQANGWMTLTQAGYDAIDNTNGELIKTAGYAGGLTESKVFGTLTIKAKRAGTAKLAVSNDSLMLDIANSNKHAGSAGATYNVVAPVQKAPTKIVTTNTADKKAEKTQENTEVTATDTATTSEATSSATTSDQVAAAAGAKSTGGNAGYFWLTALIILLLGGFAWKKWGTE